MTQRTRNFLVGSSLVTVVGLCTGLVAYYNGALPLRSSSIGPAELTYLPGDVSMLMFADVRHIVESPFHQKLRTTMPSGEGKHRLLEETGIDLERDIDTVLAGVMQTGADGPAGVALIRGRFNTADIERRAVAQGATRQEYRNKPLLVFTEQHINVPQSAAPDAPTTSHTGAVTFLEDGLIAIGDEPSVRHALDAAQAREDVTRNTDLMKLIANVSSAGDAWMVSRFDVASQASGLAPQLRDQLSGVQWLWLAAKVDRNVEGRLSAEAKDDEAAANLRAVVNGALAAARMVAGGKEKSVDGLLNSLAATGTGKSVDVSFTVPIEMVESVGKSGIGPLLPQPR